MSFDHDGFHRVRERVVHVLATELAVHRLDIVRTWPNTINDFLAFLLRL